MTTATVPTSTPTRRRFRTRTGLAAVVIASVFALTACMNSEQQTAFDLVQDTRSASGVEWVNWDSVANDKAQAWAEHLAANNTLAHSNLASGMDGGWKAISENVGYGSSIGQVQQQFMNSPSHRANILDRSKNHLGVGVAQRGDRVFVVQVFVQR